jgi:undecaprenyl diphosphate synthase
MGGGIAFVMDGNRRWARERGWIVKRGHEEGFESLKGVSLAVEKNTWRIDGDIAYP